MQRSAYASAIAVVALLPLANCLATPADDARQILATTGVTGGLIVHLGCGDGRLTGALRANDRLLVHGLDASAANVASARRYLHGQDLYGPVSVDRLASARLPYVDNLVNLVVAEDPSDVPTEEIMRVLAPGGVAYVKQGDRWRTTTKGRPDSIDEWTHYLHDATNNPVAHDTVVGPPRRLQWVGSPRWSRNHDRMASMHALVSANGRIFYAMDEGSRASVLLPSHWKLVARDAFNGVVLWKRDLADWYTQLWPLKSGPTQLMRRVVAVGDRVYATLALHAPVTALNAATGETVRTYQGTNATEEILCSDGVLFLLVNPKPEDEEFTPDRTGTWNDTQRVGREVLWDEKPRQLMAVNADTGKTLWSREYRVCPMTPTVDAERVYFHDGEKLIALDRQTGGELWQSEPVSRRARISKSFGPNLIAYEGVLVFTGGDRKMTGLSAETGKVLWTAQHPRSGHASQEDLMIVDGLVWTAPIANGKDSGEFKGLDPHTGEVKATFAPDVETYWFHHRCYRSKATDNYLLTSRTGIEFVDYRKQHWDINHWVRGGCIYGVMPANGLLYAPPHDCACYLEAKLYGLNALAAQSESAGESGRAEARLQHGPAFGGVPNRQSTVGNRQSGDWPTYRHDGSRSGATTAAVLPGPSDRSDPSDQADLSEQWTAKLGGKLSAVTVAEGKLFVAAVDAHTLYALDAGSGKEAWHFIAGGRIDSPPTIHEGKALFGCTDGWVYCLRAADGELVWRFRAGPDERRLMAFEQLESPWPVHGSVLVQRDPDADRDVLYCVVGRSMFLDGGLRLLRLDPTTGELLSETLFDERDQKSGKELQAFVKVLNMPTALPDVLSSDGQYVYMRSQRLTLSGDREEPTPQPAEPPVIAKDQEGGDRHLFCPVGFLDDSWFHRSYWIYGRRYSEGCNWWNIAGQFTPAGRLLTFDDANVYGYGRKPDYFQWSVPLDYHLFRCSRDPELRKTPSAGPSEIVVAKSESLNPTGTPLTFEAWVHADKPDGVVLARGGASHGYGLMLKGGKPSALLRINNELHAATGEIDVVGRWVHLAGVLTEGKELQLFVDGKQVASSPVPDFIKADPAEVMQIGTDQGSPLGDYEKAPRFVGRIDEVRIYRRALEDNELQRHAAGEVATNDSKALVLHYSFDEGDARDHSGNGNEGGVGAVPAEGRLGKAMSFDAGVAPQRSGPRPLTRQFQHTWSHDAPIHVQAMVLAGNTLFAAGPPDVLDEEQAYIRHTDADIQKQLLAQEEAFAGKHGALLLATSAADGKELARFDLNAPPTWDGMAAAGGKLYVATAAGEVICLAGK